MASASARITAVTSAAALLLAAAACGGSKDRTPGTSPAAGQQTTGSAAATAPSLQSTSRPSAPASKPAGAPTLRGDSDCPTDKIPLPDGATIKGQSGSDFGAVKCLQYTIDGTVADPRAAWQNAQAKARAAGYEVEAEREPSAYTFEAKRNENSPWLIITYVFGDDYTVRILAELRHS